jgi:hypothetical protein
MEVVEMQAKYHILKKYGRTEPELVAALADGRLNAVEVHEEIEALPDRICDACFVSRQYRGILRRALKLSVASQARVEADHAVKMAEALKARGNG